MFRLFCFGVYKIALAEGRIVFGKSYIDYEDFTDAVNKMFKIERIK